MTMITATLSDTSQSDSFLPGAQSSDWQWFAYAWLAFILICAGTAIIFARRAHAKN